MTKTKEKGWNKTIPSLFIMLLEESLSELLARDGREIGGGDIQNGFATNKSLLFHAVCRTRAGYENT